VAQGVGPEFKPQYWKKKKDEYRIFKPVEITMRRGLRQKRRKMEGWTNSR
jgi:hypothetical protein